MPEKRVTVWVQRFKDRQHLVLQWIDPDTGKRKSRSAETADEKVAEDKRVDLESDLNNGRYRAPSKTTWEGFREVFEREYVAPLRKNTRRNYKAALDLFERLCHPRLMDGISERTVSAFAADMRAVAVPGRGQGMKASSMKTTLRQLRTALLWAEEHGYLTKCPKFPKVKVPKKKPQPVPGESFERLLAKAPDHLTRVYLLTGWLAGLRLCEAFELEWEPTREAPYLDLARDRIILPAEIVKAVEDQWVPLDPKLKAALLQLPRQGPKVFRFLNRSGRPLTSGSMSKRVRILARQAGVKLTMHTLRKGFGCRYAAKVPAQVLQKLMRHADIKTTVGYYANVDDAVEEAVLGPRRNRRRNTPAQGEGSGETITEPGGREEVSR